MWYDDDDVTLAAAAYIILGKRKSERKHKFWVRPSLQERSQCGGLELLNTLKKDDLLSGQITDGHQ
jgi:hypothetical protein